MSSDGDAIDIHYYEFGKSLTETIESAVELISRIFTLPFGLQLAQNMIETYDHFLVFLFSVLAFIITLIVDYIFRVLSSHFAQFQSTAERTSSIPREKVLPLGFRFIGKVIQLVTTSSIVVMATTLAKLVLASSRGNLSNDWSMYFLVIVFVASLMVFSSILPQSHEPNAKRRN